MDEVAVDFTLLDAPQDTAAKERIFSATGTPEDAAQSIKIGKKLQLPAETINLNPKIFKEQADLDAANTALDANPNLADFVKGSQVRAQASKDDLEQLNRVGERAGDLSNPGILSQALEHRRQQRIGTFERAAEGAVEGFGPGPLGWSDEQREKNPWLVRPTENVPFVKLGIMAGDAFFRSFSAALTGGSIALGEFLGTDMMFADPALRGQAGQRRLQRDILIAAQGLVQEAGMRAPVPMELNALARGAKVKGEVPTGGGAVGADVTPISELGKKAFEEGEHLAPGLDFMHDQVHVAQATVDHVKLDALMKESQESQLKQRAPGEYAEYLRGYDRGEVSISPDTIVELYQKEGKSLGETDGLFGYVPDLEAQIQRGLATGTEIKIPVADYVAHTDPTVHNGIRDQVRLREGVTKEEAKEIKKADPEDYLELWHGSAAEFEAFDTKFMGSGEGAQAYAYGHYLAQNKEVAADYQKRLAADRSTIFVEGKALEEDNPLHLAADALRVQKTSEQAISKIEAVIGNLAEPYKTQQTETLSLLKRFQKGEVEIPRAEERAPEGTVYRVKSKKAENEFLDWDTPLDQQPAGKKVLEKIDPAFKEQLEDYLDRHDQTAEIESLTGGEFHKLLERWATEDEIPGVKSTLESEANPRIHVADYLKSLDLPGVKFLDQGSRPGSGLKAGPEKETRNFVVFRDEDLQILQRNEKIFADPTAKAVLQTVEAERKISWLKPLFADAKSAGMTEAEFARYSKKLQNIAEEIDAKALRAAEREVARRQTPEWKKNEAETRAEVENDLAYNPSVMADRFLRTGEYPGAEKPTPFKLNRADVESLYGKSYLPENMLAAEGLPLDAAAPFFGFNSGEAMARNLSLLTNQRSKLGEAPRQYYKRITDELTASRMERKYGNLADLVRREADEMVARSTQEEILSMEMEAISAQAGGELPLTLSQIRAAGARVFAETPMANAIRVGDYTRAAGRSGRAAELALLKGDFAEAFKHKQRQLLAMTQLNHAKAFAQEVARAERLFDRYADNVNIEKVSQAYTDQIHRLLNAVGHQVRRDTTHLENSLGGISLPDFIAERNSKGAGIVTAQLPAKNNLRNFTTDEYSDFHTMIKSMDHSGREERLITVRGEKEAYENAIAEAAKSLDGLEKKGFDPKKSWTRKIGRNVDARLIKFEQMMDWMDKNDPNGIFNEIIYKPLIKSEGGKADMLTTIAKDIKAIKMPRKWGKKLAEQVDNQILENPDRELMKLTHENKIVIALNMGNRSNMDVLLRGRRWTENDVNAFLDRHMTKEDWKFVQGIWRIFDKLAPHVENVTSRRSGVSIKMVEPTSVGAKGELQGGYYPLIADADWTLLNKMEDTDLFQRPYFDPLPMAQALKQRTGKVYPVELTLGSLHNRIGETVHAVFMQEAVTNANKVISDPIIREGVAKAFGPEYVKQFDVWIRDIANNGSQKSDVGVAYASRMLRENTVAMLMGFKASTAAIHGLAAMSTTAYELGRLSRNDSFISKHVPGGDYLRGYYQMAATMKDLGIAQFLPDTARRFFANEKTMWEQVDFVYQNSAEIRNRARNMNADFGYHLNNVVAKTKGEKLSGMRSAWLTWSMSVVAYTDQLTTAPIWMASYKKYSLDGMSHADAILAADKAVRQAHGSASLVNRSNLSRGGETERWITFAYNGYWNHNYARVRDAAREYVFNPEAKWWDDTIVKGSSALAAVIIVPAIFHHMIRGSDSPDQSFTSWMAEGVVAQFAGLVPVVNGLTFALSHGYDPSVSPMGKIFENVADLYKDVKRYATKDEEGNQFVRHALSVPGYFIGLGPTDQIATSAQFMRNVRRGTENPRSIMEWGRGLLSGHAQPKVK